MKKIIFVTSALICAYATGFAQSKAPAVVTTAFNQKFPDATNVKWDKENAHEYEAECIWKAVKFSANFSDKGTWLETESPVTFGQLPEVVQKAFKTSNKGATVKDVSKIDNSKGKTIWEIEIAQAGKTIEKFYLPDGTETKE